MVRSAVRFDNEKRSIKGHACTVFGQTILLNSLIHKPEMRGNLRDEPRFLFESWCAPLFLTTASALVNLLNPRLAKLLGGTTVVMLVVVLAFRFAVYRHMYIAPNAPFGISDVIELLLGLCLMAVLGASFVAAIALAIRGPRANRIAAAWLFGICLLVTVLVEPLHTLAAKWAP